MRTIGEILKKARLEKRLSLDDVEKHIKIRKKFLEALESNTWERLPSLPYIKGFLRNYSIYLGLKPEEVVAVFRRQFREKDPEKIVPTSTTRPVQPAFFRLTPTTIIIGGIFSFILVFFVYLFFQYRSFISAPQLTIKEPQEGQVFTTATIQVSGNTDSDAVVSVNKQNVPVSDHGDFSTTFQLVPGTNTLQIESASKTGKKTSETRTVQMQ